MEMIDDSSFFCLISSLLPTELVRILHFSHTQFPAPWTLSDSVFDLEFFATFLIQGMEHQNCLYKRRLIEFVPCILLSG